MAPPIIGHLDVLAPQTLSGDSGETARTKLNSNASLAESEAQKIEERVEHSLSSLFGEGLLTVPTIAYTGSSLAVTIGAFTYLCGVYLSYAGGQATLLASQTGATLYLNNDLTFSTTLPTVKSYVVFGTYTTSGSGVTSFALNNKLLLPKLVTITGTVSGIVVPESPGYADGYLDHSSTSVVGIDGNLTLTVTPDSDFYVEELYSTPVVTTDSDTLNSPPHNRTEKGFHYRITRRSGYYYAGNNSASLTYTRTFLAIAV